MTHNGEVVIGRRALLKKDGGVDVQFELRRNSDFDFAIFENGKNVGVFWRTLSPEEARRGNLPPQMNIDDAWVSCVSRRFPGYTASAMEDLVVAAA